MASQAAFNATKCSMSILGAFFAEVAKEVGEEKALEMYARQGSTWGEAMAQIIKNHVGRPDAVERIQAELGELYKSLGLTYTFEQEDGKLIVYSHECPMWAGLEEAGLEPRVIKKMCQSFTAQEAKGLREVLPQSSVSLVQIRNSADGYCREEIRVGT